MKRHLLRRLVLTLVLGAVTWGIYRETATVDTAAIAQRRPDIEAVLHGSALSASNLWIALLCGVFFALGFLVLWLPLLLDLEEASQGEEAVEKNLQEDAHREAEPGALAAFQKSEKDAA